jgi:glucose uptake protein
MILPNTYIPALLLAVLALFCWGTWANTCKLAGSQRFELYYWDYALGVLLAATVAAFTFGSLGFQWGGDVGGFAFLDDVTRSSKHSMAYGMAAGAVWNLGTILLVAAISLAGMSLAFPVGLGLAVTVALVLDYIQKPQGNPVLLLSAVVPILAVVALDVVAYRSLSLARATEEIKAGRTRSTKVTASWKAVVLAAIGGLLVALCEPLVDLSRAPDLGMGPYTAAFMFAAGVFASTFIYNLFFMNLPVHGQPIELREYFRQRPGRHLLPLLGGMVWAGGLLCYFVATSAITEGSPAAASVPLLGPATGHVLVLGAALLSALWGLLVWKEFAGASGRVRALLALMVVLLAGTLALIAIAPPFTA